MIVVALVPPAQVPLVAGPFIQYLEPVAAYTQGRYEVSDWLEQALMDTGQTWVVFEKDGDPLDPDLVIFTEIVSYPRLNALRIVACGGRKFFAAFPAICDTIFTRFGKDAGCSRWELVGRLPWKRVMRRYGEVNELVYLEGGLRGQG